MKTKNLFLLLFISVIGCMGTLSSCAKEGDLFNQTGNLNGDGSPSGNNGEVPEYLPSGTIIKWDGHYTSGGKQYAEMNAQLTILNETDCLSNWSRDWGTYTYTKTGKNTARLSFSVAQMLSSSVRTFQYTTTLTFTNGNQFEMTGTRFVYSTITGSATAELHCTGSIN